MHLRTDSEELRTCLTHERFHSQAAETPKTSEVPEVPEVQEQRPDCSPENYMGIVSKSSLSHQAAAIRRLQERRKKFSDFMPK